MQVLALIFEYLVSGGALSAIQTTRLAKCLVTRLVGLDVSCWAWLFCLFGAANVLLAHDALILVSCLVELGQEAYHW